MSNDIQALRQEVAALRKELNDWANGIQLSLSQMLPLLLRDHSHAQYVALSLDPTDGEPGESSELFESRAMLYRMFGPRALRHRVDPQEFTNRRHALRTPAEPPLCACQCVVSATLTAPVRCKGYVAL